MARAQADPDEMDWPAGLTDYTSTRELIFRPPDGSPVTAIVQEYDVSASGLSKAEAIQRIVRLLPSQWPTKRTLQQRQRAARRGEDFKFPAMAEMRRRLSRSLKRVMLGGPDEEEEEEEEEQEEEEVVVRDAVVEPEGAVATAAAAAGDTAGDDTDAVLENGDELVHNGHASGEGHADSTGEAGQVTKAAATAAAASSEAASSSTSSSASSSTSPSSTSRKRNRTAESPARSGSSKATPARSASPSKTAKKKRKKAKQARASNGEPEPAVAPAPAGGAVVDQVEPGQPAHAQEVLAPDPPQFCSACGAQSVELNQCGRCFSASYCNRECQQHHWPSHRLECVRLASLRDQ